MGGLLIPPLPIRPKAGTNLAKRNRIPGFALAVVVAALFGLLLWKPALGFGSFVFYESGVEGYLREAKFEASAWRANSLDGNPMWPTRLRMVDDLLRRHLLEGRTGAGIQMLLGPPNRTPTFRDRDLFYALGPNRGFFRLDSEWLVIRLNSSGKVSGYWLETIKD
jgi:hypothetical protein